MRPLAPWLLQHQLLPCRLWVQSAHLAPSLPPGLWHPTRPYPAPAVRSGPWVRSDLSFLSALLDRQRAPRRPADLWDLSVLSFRRQPHPQFPWGLSVQ